MSGADGGGLRGTEQVFFQGERLVGLSEMILADEGEGRRAALARLPP